MRGRVNIGNSEKRNEAGVQDVRDAQACVCSASFFKLEPSNTPVGHGSSFAVAYFCSFSASKTSCFSHLLGTKRTSSLMPQLPLLRAKQAWLYPNSTVPVQLSQSSLIYCNRCPIALDLRPYNPDSVAQNYPAKKAPTSGFSFLILNIQVPLQLGLRVSESSYPRALITETSSYQVFRAKGCLG